MDKFSYKSEQWGCQVWTDLSWNAPPPPPSWWPQFWPEPKNDRNDFEMIFRELSNAAFRFSLRRPGAEIMGGVQTPPPHRRWKIQRPSRARVTPRPCSRILPPSPVDGGYDPLAIGPDCRRASRKKKQSMRLDKFSRLHILFLVLRQHLTSSGQGKGQIFTKKMTFLYLQAHSGVSMCYSDLNLHQHVPCSILNKIQCWYCIPLQHLAYVVPVS